MTTERQALLKAGDQIRKLVLDHLLTDSRHDRLPIIDLTLRRATSTYEALELLARHDYPIQALVLSRTLFEDVVTAYWVQGHPNPAKVGARFGVHRSEALAALNAHHAQETSERRGVPPDLAVWMGEPIDPRQSWTGKSMKQLLDELDTRREDEDWRERVEKLREMWSFSYSLSNYLVHTTPLGLDLQEPLGTGERFDQVACSFSLEWAYTSYLLLATLVIEKEADESELHEFRRAANAITSLIDQERRHPRPPEQPP